MLQVNMFRIEQTAQYTLSILYIKGVKFWVLERPWLDNRRNLSCIYSGSYRAEFLPKSYSGRYTNVYHLQDVPGRSGILIHSGNIVSHTKGCLLLGMSPGYLLNQRAVLSSKKAMRLFTEICGGRSLQISLYNATVRLDKAA